jgi:hypothetical protein
MEDLTDLYVLISPEYEKVTFGMSSFCMYAYMCMDVHLADP